MDKEIVHDALALTPMQEYWLEKLQEAYKEFTKFGGYLFNMAECSDYLLAINANAIVEFNDDNYINLVDYSNGFKETDMKITEYLDAFEVTMNLKK